MYMYTYMYLKLFLSLYILFCHVISNMDLPKHTDDAYPLFCSNM